ncbi:hypothetical protein [Candidatus Amarolinea dominans]|uniref:hypothetical protein n=1 Tax=Candidatus Amarolinea dominans TaxID=3140696 RepID=UPI001D8E7791|nr:hypothetical protein [Anaerolineae bacterium]
MPPGAAHRQAARRVAPDLAKLWQEGLQQSYLATSTVFGTQGDPLPKRLERAYTQSFADVSLAYNQQATLLAWCLEVAQKRTQAIVGGQHRKSYDKAAILTVACAEVLQLPRETGRPPADW